MCRSSYTLCWLQTNSTLRACDLWSTRGGLYQQAALQIDQRRLRRKFSDELSTSGIFRQINAYDPHPYLVLTGRIERFYEHDRRKIWTFVPYYSDKLAGLFRLNTYMSTGEVKMTMMLLKPTGEKVRTYRGLVRFDEDFTPNDEMQPGDRLNRAFSQAVGQIRDDMLGDTTLPKARLA